MSFVKLDTTMNFKEWLFQHENANDGGLPPNRERPLVVKKDQCGAFPTGTTDGSDLPPTPKHPFMKKKMHKAGQGMTESEKRTAAKSALYPAGYGGITLYPDLYYMPIAADHAYYMSVDPKHPFKDKIRVWQKPHGKKPI
jgi:hypothetical protein